MSTTLNAAVPQIPELKPKSRDSWRPSDQLSQEALKELLSHLDTLPRPDAEGEMVTIEKREEEHRNGEEDDEDVDVDDEDEDMDDEDDDVDAQAEAVAKSLGDQLWAEIGRAFAVQPKEAPANGNAVDGIAHHGSANSAESSDSLTQAISIVLQQASVDGQLYDCLARTAVPGYDSLLAVLKHVAKTGEVQEDEAEILSDIIMGIARGSSAPSHKRKRDANEDGWSERRPPPPTPTPVPAPRVESIQEIKSHLFATVSVISHALSPNLLSSDSDPERAQSEQILTFTYACAHRAEAEDVERSELSALVWMIRTLSGTHSPLDDAFRSLPSTLSADGRAMYPCVHPNCNQRFLHLQALRSHQEQHVEDRPYRCRRCPMSFARNHDLKRHNNSHDKKTFLCSGCSKVYTRRDAVKRHKDHPRSADACRNTEIVEILPEGDQDWNDHSDSDGALDDNNQNDYDDEVNNQSQAVISQLYSLLQHSSHAQMEPSSSHYAQTGFQQSQASSSAAAPPDAAATLSNFGLSVEHTQLLQRAIAITAEAARQQAEKEAQDELEDGSEPDSEAGEGSDEEKAGEENGTKS